jgi:acyl carrier protein
VLRIFEGPTETLAMHLGAQMFNPRSDLKAFLSQELRTPELADRLFAGAADILARYQHRQDGITARRSAYLAAGELGAIALLLAAQQSTATASSRALEWTQLYFEQQLAQVLQPTPNEVVTASAHITAEWVTRYTKAIGDIEQSLAGEEPTLDDFLKKEPDRRVHPRSDAPSPVLREDPPAPEFGRARDSKSPSIEKFEGPESDSTKNRATSANTQPPTAKALEQWLVQWLAQHLKLSTAEIETDKAFADYGVDSVMAVELAQDLEEFLQLDRPLDATLAWNFPTIAALAAHLATHASSHNSRRLIEAEWNPADRASLGFADALPNLQALDDLSEVEMADALAAELAALQGRGA